MNLTTLIISFAAVGALLTYLTVRAKAQKSVWISFLQHFTGVWLIFSGFVKAVDPLGLALKQQEYFSEFKLAFNGTSNLKWLAPLMESMSQNAVGISIAVIVLEIVLGVMLITGYKPRWTAWLFFAMILFFTVLTGYTHLTGYVPREGNFFTSAWQKIWSESNMRVTDCGCFGEFLKLKPTVSFYKDIFLTGIALVLLWKTRSFHELSFTKNLPAIATWSSLIVSSLFCWQNTYLNEPVIDFRPFREGVNVREQKKAEEKAQSEIDITFRYQNLASGNVQSVPMKQVTAEYGDTTKWKLVDRINGEPAVPRTKISDFRLEKSSGEDMTDTLLLEKGFYLLAVSGKIYANEEKIKTPSQDSVFRDTTIGGKAQRVFVGIETKDKITYKFSFDRDQAELFRKTLNPLLEKAEKAGAKIGGLIAYDGTSKLEQFRHETQSAYPFFLGDEKLVKTVMRSNPGLILFKDGQIVKKWHKNHLPSVDEIQNLVTNK